MKPNRSWTGVFYTKILDAFHLYIGMCISEHLLGNIVLGGALYLCGQVLVVFARLFSKRNSPLLPHNIQMRGIVIFIATALLSAALLFLYPSTMQSGYFSTMLYCIALLLLRQGVTDVLANWLQVRNLWRVLVLLGTHAAFSIGIALLLSQLLEEDAFRQIITMVAATGFAALAHQALAQPRERPMARANTEKLFTVSSYRIYNRMVGSAVMALNLALLSYICYMQFEPQHTMLERFWDLVVWLLLVGGVTLLMLQFLKRNGITQYDKPSVFAAGMLMIAFAILGTYREWFTGIWAVMGYLLWGLGLAAILSIIISLGADMQAVLELDMTPEEIEGYGENTQAVVEWSLTLSTWLLLVMLAVITFLTDGKLEELRQHAAVQVSMRWMLFLPPAFAVIALLYGLMQPLNKDYERKLAHYYAQQRQGKANPALKTRLQLMLVKRTRRIAPSILRAIIRPLMPCRVIGTENVDELNGPVVFVSNHLEIYGPLITNLHLPFYFRSWIIARMLDKDVVAQQLEGGVNAVFKWLPKQIRARLPRWISPIVLFVLHSLDPIPVYRGNMREVLQTIRNTVDAMEYEDNILIFPENPDLDGGQYKVHGVSPFFSGFANIGSEYYKRTGNCTTFYPMYANRTAHTLTIGAGVRYDPANGKGAEKERIVDTLYRWMCDEAKKSGEE